MLNIWSVERQIIELAKLETRGNVTMGHVTPEVQKFFIMFLLKVFLGNMTLAIIPYNLKTMLRLGVMFESHLQLIRWRRRRRL